MADNQTLPAVAPNAQKDLYPEERVYTDTLKGYETKEYVFSVSAGQHVDIQFNTDNPSSYFNVTPEGSRTAIFIGSMSGAHFDQTFTAAGDYKVLVYLMRNAARRNETASYDLQIRLSGKLPAEGPEPLARSRMHPSWDVNNDGVNDCEQDGSCDHTVDYSKPRP
ncbi:hypothetical protein [Pseudomaricurvus sp.]|uniref:hypothetical protein n=1 Tax=Pseudomaricurvus sp. TaxID=2004510 RepID=UPI003F6C307D